MAAYCEFATDYKENSYSNLRAASKNQVIRHIPGDFIYATSFSAGSRFPLFSDSPYRYVVYYETAL